MYSSSFIRIGLLKGLYQTKNTRTLLTAIPELRKAGYNLSEQAVRSGFAHVCELTGLMGRWQKLPITNLTLIIPVLIIYH